MTLNDVQVGTRLKVLMTGSFQTTITGLTDTHFKFSDPLGWFKNDYWFDRKLLFMGEDPIVHFKREGPAYIETAVPAKVLMVHLSELYKSKENENGKKL